MKLPKILHINGYQYSRRDLEAYSRLIAGDERQEDWRRSVFAFISDFLDETIELEQRSSGTTGDPKVFCLERDAMLLSAQLTLNFFDLEAGDRVLLALPVEYIAGKMMVVRALLGGLDLRLTEPSSRPLEKVEGEFCFVPLVPLQVLTSMDAGDALARCGRLLVGGGALEPEARKKLSVLEVPEIWASFGMSETYTHFALQRINGPDPDRGFHCLPGVKISIDDRSCLLVDIPGITKGSQSTNDLVELIADGLGFRWLGRYDNVINSGGIKIIPEIMEERMEALLGVPVLLLPEDHDILGQQLVLLAECPQQDFDPEGWRLILDGKLDRYEVPRKFLRTDLFPRNASMKPDRRAALACLPGN